MKSNEFQEFQRASPVGAILVFIKEARKSIGQLLGVFALSYFQKGFREYLIYLMGGILLWIIIRVVLQYRNYQFRVDSKSEEFQLKKGIFKTSKVLIPLAHIQSVQLTQNFWERGLQVFHIELDTAGSQEEEVELLVLSEEKAKALQSLLRHTNTDIKQEDRFLPNVIEQETISYRNLCIGSLLANHFRTLIFIIGTIMAFISRNKSYVEEEVENKWWKIFDAYTEDWGVIYIFFFLCAILLIMLFTLIKNSILYYPFKYGVSKSSLSMEYGMFSRSKLSFSLSKIQLLNIRQNIWEKRKGIFNLRFSQINESQKNEKKNIGIPFLSKDQIQKFLKSFGIDQTFEAYIKPHFVYFIRSITISVILGILFTGVLIIFFNPPYYLYILIIIFTLINILFSYFSYQRTRYAFGDTHLQSQWGFYTHKTQICAMRKIQSITIKQKIWHKKRGIASVEFQTAGGEIEFEMIAKKQIQKWVNEILYSLEKSSFHLR